MTYPEMPPQGHYCVPLLYGDELLGILNTYLAAGHERVPQEEQLLTTVADTLAGVIVRDRVERQRQELQEKLSAQASELQQQVAERTDDLASTNLELRARIALQRRLLTDPTLATTRIHPTAAVAARS